MSPSAIARAAAWDFSSACTRTFSTGPAAQLDYEVRAILNRQIPLR